VVLLQKLQHASLNVQADIEAANLLQARNPRPFQTKVPATMAGLQVVIEVLGAKQMSLASWRGSQMV
jgi:hypothetical protein